MAYNFLNVAIPNLRKVMHSVFGTVSGHDHDGVNSKKAVEWHTMVVPVEDVAAGADIADRVVAIVPTGQTWLVTAAKIISNGTAAGIDDSNTSEFVLKNGTDAIFTQTYDADPGFPAAGSATVPTLDADHTSIAAGTAIKFSLTNGATANTPLCSVQFTYKVTIS